MENNNIQKDSGFRNYSSVCEAIRENYRKQRTYQTFDYVISMQKKYHIFCEKISIWECIAKLDNFVDISDPDISLPNSHHLFQTAEAIRRDGHPDWFQLVGLIHDLGKLIYIKGCDEEGTSMEEQWGIVGDTFIVGCQIPEKIIYPEFNKLNPDMLNPKFNTKFGIYGENCGLDNCIISYGHDEYLYQVLKYNHCKIPVEGLDIIRYHSLYPWHKENEYQYLMNLKDVEMKKWIQLFNKYDLYSKENKPIKMEEMKKYYAPIVKKYMNEYLYL